MAGWRCWPRHLNGGIRYAAMFKTLATMFVYALEAYASLGLIFAVLFCGLEFNVWTPKHSDRALVSDCKSCLASLRSGLCFSTAGAQGCWTSELRRKIRTAIECYDQPLKPCTGEHWSGSPLCYPRSLSSGSEPDAPGFPGIQAIDCTGSLFPW